MRLSPRPPYEHAWRQAFSGGARRRRTRHIGMVCVGRAVTRQHLREKAAKGRAGGRGRALGATHGKCKAGRRAPETPKYLWRHPYLALYTWTLKGSMGREGPPRRGAVGGGDLSSRAQALMRRRRAQQAAATPSTAGEPAGGPEARVLGAGSACASQREQTSPWRLSNLRYGRAAC